MLTRRKMLLSMLDAIGPSSSLRIQKMMFLYCMSLGNDSFSPYQFFPNIRGAYSLSLRDDYHAMLSKGLLDFIDNKYSISDAGKSENYEISMESQEKFNRMAKLFASFDDNELTGFTYKVRPEYAVRSQILDTLTLPQKFYDSLEREKTSIAASEKALYTIGYEGKSIDQFLKSLISHDIKLLVDVRKNAFSMRYEYNKGYLTKALDEAGIMYMHCSAVGIESCKRSELLPYGQREELFAWYCAAVLPLNHSFVHFVAEQMVNGNVALMCYEKNPEDCHRSHLASFCLENVPSIRKVIAL